MTPHDPDETREPASPRRPLTAPDLLKSDLVGMWADRTDIADSSEFAGELRRQVATDCATRHDQ